MTYIKKEIKRIIENRNQPLQFNYWSTHISSKYGDAKEVFLNLLLRFFELSIRTDNSDFEYHLQNNSEYTISIDYSSITNLITHTFCEYHVDNGVILAEIKDCTCNPKYNKIPDFWDVIKYVEDHGISSYEVRHGSLYNDDDTRVFKFPLSFEE